MGIDHSREIIMSRKDIVAINEIKEKIYSFRDVQVMIDKDLSVLYKVDTRVINQAVKRNIDRFPDEFMFQLTEDEYAVLKSQFVTSSWGGRRTRPYVFTEQGVAMLSAVLRSPVAVEVSIQIMNAFVEMRKYIAANAAIFTRLNRIEQKQLKSDENFEKIFKALESQEITPQKGIFFDGQVFDAHKFVSDIFKSAKLSIVIIDNYIDDTVLTQLTKKMKNVNVRVYTKKISKQLSLDVERFNKQYPSIKIKILNTSHDRFIIIDEVKVYHVGASLKDLGKKWFAFSRFDKSALELIDKLK